MPLALLLAALPALLAYVRAHAPYRAPKVRPCALYVAPMAHVAAYVPPVACPALRPHAWWQLATQPAVRAAKPGCPMVRALPGC
jgi:hypothetical protein